MREPRGSVLLLLPAAVLLFIVLGALCVDFAGAYAAERDLANLASAASSDAATGAIDLPHLYATGEVRLLPDRAEDIAAAVVAGRGLDRVGPELVSVEVEGRSVTVRLRGRAPFIFAKAVPGGPDGLDVSASSTATAQE